MNTDDVTPLVWRKSAQSEGSDNCIEIAHVPEGVLIRDSKDPDGAILTFTPSEWRAFLGGAKDGEFDL